MRHLFLLASVGDLEGSTCATGGKKTRVTLKDAWFFSHRHQITSHSISNLITW